MERITKQFLIDQGFIKDVRSISRWTYKGIGGCFSENAADGEGIFYFFDFNPAVMYESDLLFIKRLIDYKFSVKMEHEFVVSSEPSGLQKDFIEAIRRVSMTNENIKNLKGLSR